MRTTIVLVVLAALVWAPTATAQTGSRQSLTVAFVEQRPGMPSALSFNVDYVNPENPSDKPPAVRTVVETLAAGARFDTDVPQQCRSSDAELMLAGAGACPPGSRVGTGYIRIDTGFPDPNRFIEADVTFLNNAGQVIFLSTDRQTGARVVSRATIEGGRLTSTAPPLPGTPPDGGALDVVRTRLDAITREIGGTRRAYIATPPDCPAGGEWANTVSFTYADGIRQTVVSRSPCVPAAAATPPTARRGVEGLRLAVWPRRVRAGRCRRFRLRAYVVRRGRTVGVRGATIRFAGRVLRTDRLGRATLVAEFRRPGRRFAVARARGRRAASTAVQVLRG